MCKGIVVDFVPTVADECRDEQQQGAARLVEVGDEPLHDVPTVARHDDDAGRRDETVEAVAVEIVDEGEECVTGRNVGRAVVRLPLFDDEPFGCGIGVLYQRAPHVIEAFECAHRGGAYGDDPSRCRGQCDQGLAGYRDILGVHRMAGNRVALHRFEGTGAHMQGEFEAGNAFHLQCGEDFGGEVQAGRGGGHGAFDARIDRLVGYFVALFAFPVEVGRNGQFAESFEQRGKRDA